MNSHGFASGAPLPSPKHSAPISDLNERNTATETAPAPRLERGDSVKPADTEPEFHSSCPVIYDLSRAEDERALDALQQERFVRILPDRIREQLIDLIKTQQPDR